MGFTLITMIGKVRKTNQSETSSDLFSALQIIFLFFLQENNLRKALVPFIGVISFTVIIIARSHLLGIRLAKQAGRFEDQDQDQQGKGKDIFIITGDIACGKTLGQTQYQTTEYGAWN